MGFTFINSVPRRPGQKEQLEKELRRASIDLRVDDVFADPEFEMFLSATTCCALNRSGTEAVGIGYYSAFRNCLRQKTDLPVLLVEDLLC